MVGLVVVCHSRALARAAVALAAQMVPGDAVPIEVAAGLDESTYGTDAVAITAAITAADRGDGVVVLMDLGSAVLSAELAVEMLDDSLRDRVALCPAPLVEGLVAAAVTAAGGAPRAEVAAEAIAALAGKQSHLGEPAPADTDSTPGTPLTVRNRHGLHARPAARLVALARTFDADVWIRNLDTGSPWVSASSLSRVATLGARQGHRIEVRASGPEARRAVEQIAALADRAFDDPDPATVAPTGAGEAGSAFLPPPVLTPTTVGAAEPPTEAVHGKAGTFQGLAASPGVATGPARHLAPAVPDLPDLPSQDPGTERRRIEDAVAAVRTELTRVRDATARDAGDPLAAIFDAHLLLLDDAALLDDVRDRIGHGHAAPQAWSAAADAVAAGFDALPDPYLTARAADVRAVAAQVLRALLGPAAQANATATPADPATAGEVLIAADLAPAEAATLDPARVAGVVLAFGSPTAHGAILARARGIPAVVGVGPAVLAVGAGTPVALDGGTGEVAVAPAGPVLASFRQRGAEFAARRDRAAARASAPAVTRDGVRIAVGANVGSPADARAAADGGAELAGLVRTEFLFLHRDTAPDAGEQEAAYRQIAEALGGRRITVRTLDVGGDKPLRYAPTPAEPNPFLGVRGIRHALAHPALLAEQLLAIVRLARDTPVGVMFPMISTVDEMVRARRLLDEAVARTGGVRPTGLRVGMMVEVPAAALKTAAFVPYVDFVSIGTNDLTQYALAAERGNPVLAPLADALDPGVLRLIAAVCRGAGTRVHVGVCGEVAADRTAVPLLAGLGVRELSVAPPAVAGVKEAVRETSLAVAARAAARALRMGDSAAVRAVFGSGGAGTPR
ncbi:phosphoenolpyruvate--protein phosphotransferase [Krasilnikovia sp. MM14-A1259]|uniref:phosphoenolpyruvate--protein phosphotransferase n=1 Tax=Krasilnikovia sp. MM14-A1259 TaxID=3373539 RepID=UPI00382173CF